MQRRWADKHTVGQTAQRRSVFLSCLSEMGKCYIPLHIAENMPLIAQILLRSIYNVTGESKTQGRGAETELPILRTQSRQAGGQLSFF